MDKRRSKGNNQPDLRVLPNDEPPRLIPDEPFDGAGHSEQKPQGRRASAPAYAGKSNAPPAATIADATLGSKELSSQVSVLEPEEAWGRGQKKTAPVGWLFLGAFLLLGLGVWTVISLTQSKEVIDQTMGEQKEIELDRVEADQAARNNLDAMKSIASGYLAAGSVKSMSAYVRQPERVRPLMEKFYQSHSIEPKRFVAFISLNALVLNSRPFLLAVCSLDNGEEMELLLEEVENGKYLVDWETYVHYQPMSWESFLKTRPVEPLNMRVICSIDNFYAYEFRDESKYQCYRLTSREGEDYLYGYVDRNSALMYQINHSLSRGGKMHPMILTLHFPKGGRSKRNVLIDGQLSSNWTYVTPPGE